MKQLFVCLWLSCLPVWAWGQDDYNFYNLSGQTTTNNCNLIFDKPCQNCTAILWCKSGGLVLLREKGMYREKDIMEALENQKLRTDSFPIYKAFPKPEHQKDTCHSRYRKLGSVLNGISGSVQNQMSIFVSALPDRSRVLQKETVLKWLPAFPNDTYKVTVCNEFDEVLDTYIEQDTVTHINIPKYCIACELISVKITSVSNPKYTKKIGLEVVENDKQGNLIEAYHTLQERLKNKSEVEQCLTMYVWFLQHDLLCDAYQMIEKAHHLMPQEKVITFLYGVFLQIYTDLAEGDINKLDKILPKDWRKF